MQGVAFVTIPSRDEIAALLDRLEEHPADDLESEVLEFKPWHDDPKRNQQVAVEYAACLANHLGGVIVFGVKDRVIGRADAITGCRSYDLDTFRRSLYQDTRPNLTAEVEELVVPEGTGTLLLVRVPRRPGDTPIGTAQGLYKVRVGKSCMPLDPSEWDRRQAAAGTLDWSALPMPDAVQEDSIDPLEVARVRRTIEVLRPQSDLLRLTDDKLLNGLGVIQRGALTRAGFLLVGKAERLAELVPQHELIYLHFTGPMDFDFRLDLKTPLLLALERLSEAIEARNPVSILKTGLFHINIPSFPEPVYREALLNALIHRNYLERGQVYVRHYPDHMEVANPGGLVEGITPQNFLHAEARARNRLLAEMLQKVGLVERAGVGRSRLFIPSLQFGKRAPVIEADEHTFRITLHNGSFDEPLAEFIARKQHAGTQFDLDDLLILVHQRVHEEIDTPTASRLLQRPEAAAKDKLDHLSSVPEAWLERRGKKKGVTYHLSREAAAALRSKAAYTKAKGIDRVRVPALIREYVDDHGSISNKECRELLGLGNSRSALGHVSRLLRGTEWLEPYGGDRKNRRYRLAEHP